MDLVSGAARAEVPQALAIPPGLAWRAVLDGLPLAAYACDAEGRVNYFNAHAVAVWGRTPAIGDNASRFCGSFRMHRVDGTPMPHDECWMALALRHRKAFSGCEVVIEREDGSQVVGLAHASPIFDEAGALTGAFNIIADITQQKLAERKLEEIDRRKTEFLATLSHELRNPLAPINNVATFLRKACTDAALEPSMGILERQLAQLNRLVDDLLDLTRIESNRMELRKARIDVRDVIATAIETSAPVLRAGKQALDYQAPEDPIHVDGDRVRLAQAVSNLLNNAAKFSANDGRIAVALRRMGPLVFLSVRDHGAGISAGTLAHLFEPFRQGPEGKAKLQGLGIGLALVRRICELHGGAVEALSDGPGRGSEFSITLPVAA
jgi:signal transduction histidine kinase